MITVKILMRGSAAVGFDVSGHSGYSASGSDIICAAVSAAVGLCETIINDAFMAKAEVTVSDADARVCLRLVGEEAEKADTPCKLVLSSFARQMSALESEYPKYIQVLEVQSNA